MKFNLRVSLMAISYFAVAAAAFLQPNIAALYALWLIVGYAALYALLQAIFARGRTRVAASGALVAMLTAMLFSYFAPDLMPSRMLRAWSGESIDAGRRGIAVVMNEMAVRRKQTANWETSGVYQSLEKGLIATTRESAGDAIIVQLAGLGGAVVGSLAHQRGVSRMSANELQ